MRAVLIAIALVLASSSLAVAQNPGPPIKNPRQLAFTASTDHDQVTAYSVGFFLPGALDPVQTADLGKPTPDIEKDCPSPSPCIMVTINTRPLAFGSGYVAKVKAFIGTALASEWSLPSETFDRVPGPPSKLTVR